MSELDGARPKVDISTPENRLRRRNTRIDSEPVASFVPFFLLPNARMWEAMRSASPDDRLDKAARALPASDFIMLVSSARSGGGGAIVANGDAADPETTFGPVSELGGRMPRLRFDDEDALGDAEFLIPHELQFSAIALIGVANDKVRIRVRSLLESRGFVTKVSVYPPWFQSA